ncbi:MAG TPA: ferritin-like domain-containing protein [Acidimicrobiales bacterium]|nr:ferritin-like domain-containing protein [Acidimicrobiales bacterium]
MAHDAMAVSEAEVSSLTADMIDAHDDTYATMRDGVAEWAEVESPSLRPVVSRRGFIASASAMIAGGVALAAMPAAASTRSPLARLAAANGIAGVPLDVVVAGLAASLENLAVNTYGAALSAAKADKLGSVPPAVATFVVTAMAQHADHAAAWNSILAKVGYAPITAANPVYTTVVDADFAKVRDIAGVARLALTLEGVAAATYLEAIKALSTPTAIAIAASIQPVEMQHVAILRFVLGEYPVPQAFATLSGAAPVSSANGLAFVKR